ncbi:hypothetical protein L345_15199 [Ophiophagus hannah]|uniref:Uncharacterized protein n=1 Tax=Ophiophagus hannah TaxID=8665 RepID=V8NAH0_OPHHA|nr:hypothetical protein L345_15199 [Ophiophagus hannah]
MRVEFSSLTLHLHQNIPSSLQRLPFEQESITATLIVKE